MSGYLSEQFAATFAGLLAMRLSPPCSVGEHKGKGIDGKIQTWFVRGNLPLMAHGENGTTVVELTILTRQNWLELPPYVCSWAKFMRREIDWHAYSNGGICYVLQAQWKDKMERVLVKHGDDINYVLDYAATWLLSASDSLITRHLIGERHRIEKWPDDWKAFAHGGEGVQEYLREQGRA